MARHLSHESTEERLLVSHLRLRRAMGVLGIALPFVLMFWGFALSGELQGSISAYYGLRTRDAFVGTLFVIGLFLCMYRGYERRDDRAGNLACVFALGVAFFPHDAEGWQSTMHFVCAGGLFLMLSIFSLILFTKTKSPGCPKWWRRILFAFHFGDATTGDSRNPRKRMRNRIYVFCGLVILACIVLIWPFSLLFPEGSALFWIESVMIWAFGISWFVKGNWLRWLKDKA